MSLQVALSPPALPPKTFMSPVTPPLPFSSREHIQTPLGEATVLLPPSNAQRILDTSVTRPPLSEPQVLETMSLDSDLKRPMTLSLQESHRRQFSFEPLGNEEDDELARTIAESLSVSAPLEQKSVHARNYLQSNTSRPTVVTHSPIEQEDPQQHAQGSNGMSEIPSRQRPSFLNLGGVDILSPEELEDHAAHGQIMQELEDEEVTRQLQEEEEKRLVAELREREKEDEKRARMDVEFTKLLQEEESMRLEAETRERELRDEEWARLDEEIARREAAEEQSREEMRKAQEREDAEMARRIAETNDAERPIPPREMIREAWERKDAEMARRMAETNGAIQVHVLHGAPLAHGPAAVSRVPSLPQYNNFTAASGQYIRPMVRTAQSAPQIYNGSPPTRFARAASVFASGPVRPAEQGDHPRLASVTFRGAERRSDSKVKPEGVSPPSQDPPLGHSDSGRPGVSPPGTSLDANATMSLEDDAIETHLLKGVCAFLFSILPSALLT